MIEVTYSPEMAADKELFPLVENVSRLLREEPPETLEFVPNIKAHWDAVQAANSGNPHEAVLKLKNDVVEESFVWDRKTLAGIPENPGPLWRVMVRFFNASTGKRLRILKEVEMSVGV